MSEQSTSSQAWKLSFSCSSVTLSSAMSAVKLELTYQGMSRFDQKSEGPISEPVLLHLKAYAFAGRRSSKSARSQGERRRIAAKPMRISIVRRLPCCRLVVVQPQVDESGPVPVPGPG